MVGLAPDWVVAAPAERVAAALAAANWLTSRLGTSAMSTAITIQRGLFCRIARTKVMWFLPWLGLRFRAGVEGVVRAVGELLEVGDRLGLAVQPVVGLGDRGWGDVVLAAGDQQQRRPVVVVEVDRGGGVGVEVGQAGLEQHMVGAGDGDGVAVVGRLGRLLAEVVAEGVVELLR